MKRLVGKVGLMYSRFLQVESRRWYVLIPFLVALPVVIRFLVFGNASIIGNDTQTHLYKALILQRNMEQMPFYLWGKWDWNWYCGYSFLQVYGPLFYYLIAIVSSITSLSVDFVAQIVLPFFFFLSALSMYLLCMHLTKNKLASLLGAATYAYSPYLIADFSLDGSVGSFIAFAFAPVALLYADKLCNDGNNIDAFLSAVFVGMTLLSNQATGLILLVVVLAYLLLQKKVLAGIKIAIETFLITAFWTLPYVTNIQNAFLPVTSSQSPLLILQGFLIRYLGLIPIVLLIMSLWIVRKRIRENVKISTAWAIFGLFTAFNIIIFFFPLPILSAFALGRSTVVYTLLAPVLVALAIASSPTLPRKGIMVGVFLVLLVIEGLFVQVYVPLSVQRYNDAYTFIATDGTWFRALQVPREPVGSLIPIVSDKPIIDGWFDQGSSLSSLVSQLSTDQWYSTVPTPPILVTDPQKAIAVLGYLGTKYIIIDRADPYNLGLSQALYNAINSTETATETFASGNLTVFRLNTFQNLTLATRVVAVANLTEFMDYLPFRHENEAIVYDGQQSLLPTNSSGIPSYRIFSINQSYQSMDYRFYIDRAAILVLPIAYDKSLQVTINGTQVLDYNLPPGIIGIPLNTAGTYIIKVEPEFTYLQLISLFISTACTTVFLVTAGVAVLKKKRRSKKG